MARSVTLRLPTVAPHLPPQGYDAAHQSTGSCRSLATTQSACHAGGAGEVVACRLAVRGTDSFHSKRVRSIAASLF